MSFITKNLEKVIFNEVKKYVFQTLGKKVKKISIKNFWIVRQFNNEYNESIQDKFYISLKQHRCKNITRLL